jgi:diguanylate cyclase (GGDEF)-like protein/PAS domain S-box-containing protein
MMTHAARHCQELTPNLASLGQVLFESSSDCMKILDAEGRLLLMNQNGLCTMEVGDFTSLYGVLWKSFWPAAGQDAVEQALEKARRGIPGHFTAFCPTAKGTPKWWDVIVSPIRNRHGQVEWLLAISRDITAIYETQEKLAATAERMQFSMAAAQLGEWELDLATGIIRSSPLYAQCFGYTEPVENWTLDKVLAHLHPEDRDRVLNIYTVAIAEQHSAKFEFRVIWRDQSVHWITAHAAVKIKDGKPVCLQGIISDITEQKLTEILVLGQKKAFELAVRGAPLEDVLSLLALTAEEHAGGSILASILLLDADGRHLTHCAAPSLPPSYSQALDGVEIGPNVGSCGTAAFRQEVVVVRDIQTDPLWTDYRDLAAAHNLRACWSAPIISPGGKVQGTFAFYYTEVRDPKPQEGEAMTLLVNTAALVLDRQREADARRATAKALQDAQSTLESTLAAGEVATWTWDLKGNRLYGDRNLAQFYGRPKGEPIEIPGDCALEGVHPQDLPRLLKAVETAIQTKESYEVKYRVQDGSGQYRSVVTRGSIQYDDTGDPSKILGVLLDVTRQAQSEEALRQSEERYRTLFELMDQGFCLVEVLFDIDGAPYDYRFLEVNREFADQTGIVGGIGKTARELLPTVESHWIESYGQVALTGNSVRFERESQAMGRWFDVYATRAGGADSRNVAILFTDITERKRTEQEIREFNVKLERQANYDALTGLPNRRLFRDRLDQEIRHAHFENRRIALLFLDLDRFKEVNDFLGHDMGDLLLEKVAQRLQRCVRPTDTVARLGGDEFTVILTDPDDVCHVSEVAQQMLDALGRPVEVGHERVSTACSIGITVYPTDATLPEDLIRNADQAMYRSKASGRNCLTFFSPSMQITAMQRLKLLSELRCAVSEQQLELHFQPIIELATGEITKAEALVRWRHPIAGLLGPAKFIELAEETGLIHEIGDWVFMQAAAYSKRWSDRLGKPFQISINKSPVQFTSNVDSFDWVAYLDDMGLAKRSIVVEITEGVLLNLSDQVSEKLQHLRQGGLELSIDDFGTGYSSMSYLKKLDIDYLKIDQSFVRDMLSDVTTMAIVETILLMAHKLGLKVVAEGVETIEQYQWLKDHGCNYGQGYLFSTPLPDADFETYLLKDSGPLLSVRGQRDGSA